MSSPYALGPLERDTLQVVWKKQRASVQDVLLSLNSCPTKTLAYTTVMTIMSRLVEKGVLKRAKEGRCYYDTTAEPRKLLFMSKPAGNSKFRRPVWTGGN